MTSQSDIPCIDAGIIERYRHRTDKFLSSFLLLLTQHLLSDFVIIFCVGSFLLLLPHSPSASCCRRNPSWQLIKLSQASKIKL